MPLVRFAELEIDPEQLDAYKALLTEEIDASVRLEPGVLALHAVAVAGAPAHLRIVEVYADQAAYEAHLRSPHFLKYKSLTAGMVRALRLIETDPILLRDKRDGDAGGSK
jgi:quinol monooxygenase YgiN